MEKTEILEKAKAYIAAEQDERFRKEIEVLFKAYKPSKKW